MPVNHVHIEEMNVNDCSSKLQYNNRIGLDFVLPIVESRIQRRIPNSSLASSIPRHILPVCRYDGQNGSQVEGVDEKMGVIA